MKQRGYEGDLLERADDYGLAVFWQASAFQLVACKHAVLRDLAETHLQVFFTHHLAVYEYRLRSSCTSVL